MGHRQKARPLETRPTVTVVIPCYNYGHFLPGVVRCVLDQPGVDVDIIIVDDASPDGSAAVAHALAEHELRIRVIAHETNKRHIATYNEGLSEATGDYVVLLSADDMLAPGALQRATALLEQHPETAFVYGYAPTFDDELPAPREDVRGWTVWTGDEWIRRLCRRGNNVVVNPEVVMRRSVMEKLEGYDKELPHSADMFLWMRAAALGSVGRVNGADQAYYRVHGQNMHLNDYAGVLTDITERRKAHRTLLDGDLLDHPRRAEFERLASKAVAREALQWGCVAYDQREDDWQESMEAYRSFAVETWPDVVRTPLYRRFARRAEGKVSRLESALSTQAWHIRHVVRWRRWRRFGT